MLDAPASLMLPFYLTLFTCLAATAGWRPFIEHVGDRSEGTRRLSGLC